MNYKNGTSKKTIWRVEVYADLDGRGVRLTDKDYFLSLESALREAKRRPMRQTFDEKVKVIEETNEVRYVNGVVSIGNSFEDKVVYESGYERGYRIERFDGGVVFLNA